MRKEENRNIDAGREDSILLCTAGLAPDLASLVSKTAVLSTNSCHLPYLASRSSVDILDVNLSRERSSFLSSELEILASACSPAPTAAAMAAPNAVVSSMLGRTTSRPDKSAWTCSRLSDCDRPPSTSSSDIWVPVAPSMHSNNSRTWKEIASSVA